MKILKFVSICLITMLVACTKSYVGPRTTVIINGNTNPYAFYVPQNTYGEYGIVFGNYGPATKASVTSISETGYDEFNLYAWNSNNDTIMKPYLIEGIAAGVYSYDSVTGQELQYFRNSADNYEFIGVIPTSNDMSVKDGVVTVKNVESFVVDDEKVSGTIVADSPKEFLYAYQKVEKDDYNNPVNLSFAHGNAIVYLGFTSDRNDTEILDYVPGVPAGPDVVTQSMSFKPFPAYGPTVANSSITAEDVAYINSKYDCSAGWVGYYSTAATITGDLDSSMWEYLTNEHSGLASENNQNWASYTGSTMRLVHVEVDGNNYRGWFVNVQNATITTTTIPGTSAVPGIDGIRLFSAKVVSDHYVHEGYVASAEAAISASGLVWSNKVNSSDAVQFSLPGSTVSSTAVYSPSTFYVIPANDAVTHLVVKISYQYNGLNVYDVRVPIELPAGGLVAGKYYKYTLHITSSGNGTNDPTEATNDEDEIDVIVNPVISVNVDFANYNTGEEKTITI